MANINDMDNRRAPIVAFDPGSEARIRMGDRRGKVRDAEEPRRAEEPGIPDYVMRDFGSCKEDDDGPRTWRNGDRVHARPAALRRRLP